MLIAIASGKGGTGKTTVATSLALAASGDGRAVRLLDCDVEEPNCHIFMRPQISVRETVGVPVPEVDAEKCTACGKCGDICQYSAIVSLKTTPLVFPELCHGCGGCVAVCKPGAISEVPREVGVVERGKAGEIDFGHGVLRVGEAMSPPLIQAVKRAVGSNDEDGHLTIVDAPPGTSCPVIEAVKGADFVVLVTEPTPFGLNDLRLAVEMTRVLGLPLGVVVNRAGVGDDRVAEYCAAEGVSILAELPDDRRIAEAYSRGQTVFEALEDYRAVFGELLATIVQRAGK